MSPIENLVNTIRRKYIDGKYAEVGTHEHRRKSASAYDDTRLAVATIDDVFITIYILEHKDNTLLHRLRYDLGRKITIKKETVRSRPIKKLMNDLIMMNILNTFKSAEVAPT